ncbi:Vegetative incompatibility protein HET-E-1 [Fulvia fulva]|uniref:Vegetative incompatibility protein HET-E-1 n=1 Tax=Passalora fulva TaxID=5499 RepID=A0A9Q8P2W0_PASFU|nr:Vegetative incompatibility protein HET-E-1 [Fulvia fulva]KAK4634949.1 Vegetative incompatibility protein HET-E-1 [Fulvia fulva]KAK4638268.1 Vegetative incompatibility protein HET-E-1 [Fulvia fulva]UJO11355.1 Vegetative incompatibility protein HET-E-1 [Fulvia fulva]WPV09605.1 Vegetative incompatibility protein HET-E-1 [Fulvia fulva]WPV23797.1 Vegetative incompatibility protein HET-E-1 [Fulvia fulva]
MRLIDTTTLELHEFSEEQIPYGCFAVISHRWTNDEVTFKEYRRGLKKDSIGYRKILHSCELAKIRNRQYVWIDTCCIDKRSSAELSEAINSMFRWYQRSAECYVHLQDVSLSSLLPGQEPHKLLAGSDWFTRGWTLQELLAPTKALFFDSGWVAIGSRSDDDIASTISQITGIQTYDLGQFSQLRASVARKMSWASKRKTTRPEDLAYSLLGLFDVNMPLLYGEGAAKAFMQLQLEIIRKSSDKSIFAWDWPRTTDEDAFSWPGLLAPSAEPFQDCGDIVVSEFNFENQFPYEMTNLGLSFKSKAEAVQGEGRAEKYIIDLDCTRLRYQAGREGRLRERCYIMLEPSTLNNRVYRRRHFAHSEGVKPFEERYPKGKRKDVGVKRFYIRQAGL